MSSNSKSRFTPSQQSQMQNLLAISNRIGFALLLLGVADVRADTTWVSGQVGGVWTVEGSPYMIVDSAWVNHETGLDVEAGVEIVIEGPTAHLHLAGHCRFQGSPDDSVEVTLVRWGGILTAYIETSDAVDFTFTKLTGAGWLDIESDSIRFENCALLTPPDTSESLSNVLQGNSLEIRQSSFASLIVYDANTTIQSSSFSKNLEVVYGSASIESLSFVGPDTTGFGTLSLAPWGDDRSILISQSSVRRLYINNVFSLDASVEVSNASCSNYASLNDVSDGQIHNSYFREVRLDDVSGQVEWNRLTYLSISDAITPLEITNNTFYFTDECWNPVPRAFVTMTGSGAFALDNNIFYSDRPEMHALDHAFGTISTEPAYCLTYGMLDPWQGYPVGQGNIESDPLFDPNDLEHGLRFDSPAIDAGNPQRTDTDGSVSDIGAFWWDHTYDHPPIIVTPDTIEIRWGDPFDLNWQAVDENQVTIELVGDLPDWLDDDIVPFGAQSFAVLIIATDVTGQRDSLLSQVQVLPVSQLPIIASGDLIRDHSPYYATHDVTVQAGDTLTIHEGVTLYLGDDQCSPWLVVRGALIADGDEGDSILFRSEGGHRWAGIALRGEASSLQMDYCGLAGGSRVLDSDSSGRIQLSNSSFRCAYYIGLSIRNSLDSLIARECAFAGVSTVLVANGPGFAFDSCSFVPSGDSSSALAVMNANGVIAHSTFADLSRSALSIGGGTLNVTRCIIRDITADAALYASPASSDSCRLILRHCVISNVEDGIYLGWGSSQQVMRAEIQNSVFQDVQQSVFSLSPELDSSDVVIEHNCVHDFHWVATNHAGEPVWSTLGAPIGINSNEDSVDAYGNVMAPPVLDEASFTPTISSPCIDAGLDLGDPFFGAAPDIGIIETNYSSVGPQIRSESASAITIFPNPANSTDDILIMTSGLGIQEIVVYNILGQMMRSISHPSDSHVTHSSLSNRSLTSGIYFARIRANGRWSTHRLTILR